MHASPSSPPPPLPDAIRSRGDLEVLLARATNFEELKPRSPDRPVFKLDRVRDLLASVGDPHLRPVVVHVAGSKGKGTVARMLDACLRRWDRGPVGLFTSPHLEDLSERIQVDGHPVGDAELAHAANALLDHVKKVLGTPHGITFFEMLTAMAWVVFRERGCTHVVLETGLGGRLDATNVCAPAATLITSIELEHTDVLGATLEAIAGEKAGILKSGVPAATAAEGAALPVIEQEAKERGAPLAVLGRDLAVRDATTGPGPRTTFTLDFAGSAASLGVTLATPGIHHARNAALAVWAARSLGVEDAVTREALRSLHLPGIAEAIATRPLLIIDGAHTAASARSTRAAVDAAWPHEARRLVVLLAMLEGKDVEGIARPLVPGAAGIVTTELPTPRTQRAGDLAGRIAPWAASPVAAEPDPAEALARARAWAGEDGLVLATGSVRLAGLIRALASRA